VLMVDNSISLTKSTNDSLVTYQIKQSNPEWAVLLKLPNQATSTVLVNGKATSSKEKNNYVTITLTGSDNIVSVQQ
jgi:DUF1680 family protein